MANVLRRKIPSSPYDNAVMNDVGGTVWYSSFETSTTTWPSYLDVVSGDLADNTNNGAYWFTAWWNESGNAPSDHDAVVLSDTASKFDAIYYLETGQEDSVTWPSYATTLANDYGDESEKGNYWMQAWWTDSGFAPSDPDTVSQTDLSSEWYSELSQKNEVV